MEGVILQVSKFKYFGPILQNEEEISVDIAQ